MFYSFVHLIADCSLQGASLHSIQGWVPKDSDGQGPEVCYARSYCYGTGVTAIVTLYYGTEVTAIVTVDFSVIIVRYMLSICNLFTVKGY